MPAVELSSINVGLGSCNRMLFYLLNLFFLSSHHCQPFKTVSLHATFNFSRIPITNRRCIGKLFEWKPIDQTSSLVLIKLGFKPKHAFIFLYYCCFCSFLCDLISSIYYASKVLWRNLPGFPCWSGCWKKFSVIFFSFYIATWNCSFRWTGFSVE